MEHAKLERYGLIEVSGADAREFLHAQLTNDIKNLAPDRAALAGWCSAKGRLLASFLVVPAQERFLLDVFRLVSVVRDQAEGPVEARVLLKDELLEGSGARDRRRQHGLPARRRPDRLVHMT